MVIINGWLTTRKWENFLITQILEKLGTLKWIIRSVRTVILIVFNPCRTLPQPWATHFLGDGTIIHSDLIDDDRILPIECRFLNLLASHELNVRLVRKKANPRTKEDVVLILIAREMGCFNVVAQRASRGVSFIIDYGRMNFPVKPIS